jgi:3-phosphoshikimate 1-carboxyvinyltransferase
MKAEDNNSVKVSPIKRLRGEMRIPGDKSFSHRATMISSLAIGTSTLTNYSTAADCQATIECMQALGVKINRDGTTIVIEGVGLNGLKAPTTQLDAVNSGTTTRLLSGILAGQPFETTITGDESLRSRPMKRVATPLRLMGATIETQPNGCAPLKITGRRPLRAIHYELPVSSAQIKSAVLLAGMFANGDTSVEEPVPTRDHTERMLRGFGVNLKRKRNIITITPGEQFKAQDLIVPGDVSSAAFFVAAALMLPGSDLTIRDVGLNPTRSAFLSVVAKMGGDIKIEDERIECGEPIGTLRVKGKEKNEPRAIVIAGDIVPNIIDELPLLAFLAAGTNCELDVRDAKELRVKESDRIATTVENLRRMGARVDEQEDGFRVYSGQRLNGATLTSYGDHRIAMACAIAALTCNGSSEIENAKEAVGVSLPEFWTLLDKVSE